MMISVTHWLACVLYSRRSLDYNYCQKVSFVLLKGIIKLCILRTLLKRTKLYSTRWNLVKMNKHCPGLLFQSAHLCKCLMHFVYSVL